MSWRGCIMASAGVLWVGIVAVGGASDLSDRPLESAFLADVNAANYEQLPPSEDALLLRWDFSGDTTHTYDFEQTVESAPKIGQNERDLHTRVTSVGVLDVKPQGDGTARVVVRDLKMTMEGRGKDAQSEPVTHSAAPVVVQGMREDGSFGAGKADVDTLFRFVLPLPREALEIGGSATLPVTLPVSLMGSRLDARGSVSVTLSSLVYVRGHQCAQLDSVIEVRDVEVPEEIAGKLSVAVSGRGRYFFDIDERRLLEAAVAVVMSMEASFPTPEGFASDHDRGGMTEMSMSSDNLIRLTSD